MEIQKPLSLIRFFRIFFRILLLFTIISSIFYHAFREKKRKEVSLKDVEEIAGGRWEERKEPFRYFFEKNKKNYGFLTDEIPPEIKGYCDEIGIFVEIDAEGKIISLKDIRGCETPYYFSMVKDLGFFEKLQGKKLEVNPQVDVVTGATVSSQAILKDVWSSGIKFSETVLRLKIKNPLSKPLLGSKEILILFSFIFSLAGLFLRKKKLLYGILIYNLLVMGLILKSPLTISIFGESMKGSFPSLIYISLLFWGAILISFFFKNIYCNFMCPMGCLIEVSSIPFRARKPPSMDASLISSLRDGIAAVLLFLLLFLDERRIGFIEPFSWLFSSLLFGWFALLYGLSVVAFSVYFKRFWCYYLCPTGSILHLIENIGIWFKNLFQRFAVFFPILIILFPGCGDEEYHLDIAYYAEYISYEDIKTLFPMIKKSGYSVHIAIPSEKYLDSETEQFLRAAESLNINIYLWLTLKYEEGYWINERNIDRAGEMFFKFGRWNEDKKLGIDGFVFDLEAPIYQLVDITSWEPLPLQDILSSIIQNYNPDRFTENKEKMKNLVLQLKSEFSLPVYAVTYPWVLDDMETGNSTLQDIFEIPVAGINWDEVGFMVYTTLMRAYGIPFCPGIVASYASSAFKFFGEKASLGLGIAGDILTGGNFKSFADPEYFKKEIFCSLKEGIFRFRIYSLRGPLGSPENLKNEWFRLHDAHFSSSCRALPQEKSFREIMQTLSLNLKYQ